MHSVRMMPLLLLSSLLAACSHLHVDEQGRRHVFGFVWLTLPPANVEPVGAESLRARTIGLALTRSPAGDAAVLGYSDTTVTVIRNDALVRLPAPAASSPKETAR